ncbi:DUF6452 family protein [Carboxylicivirga sp. N1Y90]|uniref:DUF6452 family protein n=1 Tax=Carboxylicivirga fragile TaxID=3417571 RepID=UPI003D356981|nr:hypothetical protein [Marinilabiliaceae bacterium N1Y90]
MRLIRIVQWSIIFAFAAIYSCSNSSICLSNQHAVQTSFMAAHVDSENDTTLNGITVHGLNNDSLLHDSASVQEMYLPMDLNRDTTEFIIQEELKVGEAIITTKDTLVFVYDKDLQYVSGDCGMTFNLILDTVIYTTNIVDSVRISYPNVNYGENLENVKIYIEP